MAKRDVGNVDFHDILRERELRIGNRTAQLMQELQVSCHGLASFVILSHYKHILQNLPVSLPADLRIKANIQLRALRLLQLQRTVRQRYFISSCLGAVYFLSQYFIPLRHAR